MRTTFQNASRLTTTGLGLAALTLLGLIASPAAHAQGYTLTTLASFSRSNGRFPEAGLTLSGTTLYGTTAGGGASNGGTVFALTPMAAVPEASSVISCGLLLLGGLGGMVFQAKRRSAVD